MPTKSKIQDQTFLFTGTLIEFTRDEAEALVEANGGKVLSGVSAKLNYLVVGDDAGSKLTKAKSLGTVTILTEKEFLKMVPNGNTAARMTVMVKPKNAVVEKKETVKASAKAVVSKSDTKKVSDASAFEEVQIGNQIWTVKNLNTDKYRNGDEIPQVKDIKKWSKLNTGAWCYYENNDEYGASFGKLYNWFAVNDPRGLAPDGYHVPTHEEWDTLLANLGGDLLAGGKLKEKGIKNWASPNTKATNQSKYSALPGGYRSTEDGFFDITEKATFWSNSEINEKFGRKRVINNSSGSVVMSISDKRQGSSVRCIKNAEESIKGVIFDNLEVFNFDIGEFSFKDAKLQCQRLGGEWRLPSKEELNFLYENKEVIGLFTDGFYWSSTVDEESVSFAWGQRFEDGFQNVCSSTEKFKNFIRPVRSIKK
jgi:uncharacterized protein (TIGR02145 family)